jgi:hypothetical protein
MVLVVQTVVLTMAKLKQWQNLNIDPSQRWTLKLIKDTTSTLNNGATKLGIKMPPLLTSF